MDQFRRVPFVAFVLGGCCALSACALSQGGGNGGRAIGEDQAQQHCLLYRKFAVITNREGKDELGREIVDFKCTPLPKNIPQLNSGFYAPDNAWFLERKHDNDWPVGQ
jgi:hypothetical protein